MPGISQPRVSCKGVGEGQGQGSWDENAARNLTFFTKKCGGQSLKKSPCVEGGRDRMSVRGGGVPRLLGM